MKNIIDNGFTVYIGNNGSGLNGCGLKNLGDGRGIRPVELQENKLYFVNQFPSTLQLLNEGNTLQIYRDTSNFPYYTYQAQIGKMRSVGPYSETDCFEIVSETASSDFYDTLIELEKENASLLSEKEKKVIKKTDRLYGEDKYQTHNMDF